MLKQVIAKMIGQLREMDYTDEHIATEILKVVKTKTKEDIEAAFGKDYPAELKDFNVKGRKAYRKNLIDAAIDESFGV